MADTIYETNHDGTHVSFTRFWRDAEDWVQITMGATYGVMPVAEFLRAVEAIKQNVADTKDAWWHKRKNIP
mgnify:CR=1 FL=1